MSMYDPLEREVIPRSLYEQYLLCQVEFPFFSFRCFCEGAYGLAY
jgi:hypothetical protein